MLAIDYQDCLSCAGCISICPEMALLMDLTGLRLRSELCSFCGFCAEFCPVLALAIDNDESDDPGGRQ
jgi:pyruvate formate lyase activating enzyme